MINETINKENLEQIKKTIKSFQYSSLTDIQKNTNIPRCQIRILIAYLLGSKEIKEVNFGMAKVYYE